MSRVVKEAFRYTFSHGNWADVPAGARVTPVLDEPGTFWVDPTVFPGGSLERHDADHYGIRVPLSNTKEH